MFATLVRNLSAHVSRQSKVRHAPTREEILTRVEVAYNRYKKAEETFNRTKGANQPELARTFWIWHNATQELVRHESRLLK